MPALALEVEKAATQVMTTVKAVAAVAESWGGGAAASISAAMDVFVATIEDAVANGREMDLADETSVDFVKFSRRRSGHHHEGCGWRKCSYI